MTRDTMAILNGRYKLLEQSGIGGMATVFKGQDLLLGRLIAVKVLHESLTNDVDFLERFQREAFSVANLSHPNIVTVHDIGQDGRRYYIVMEFVEGHTLKQLIRTHRHKYGNPLPISRAIDLAIQICEGIGYAHRANLVHCDVKSQNVLVTEDDRVKVADFGIARAFTETGHMDVESVWGTPQYFSPEQAAGKAISPASDVYSIGVIIFEMLSGTLPFIADSHTLLGQKHMEAEPPALSILNPSIPPQLDRIVAKVLSKEPSGRYRTADQLGRVLRSYRDSALATTAPPRQPSLNKPLIANSTNQAGDISQITPPRKQSPQRPFEEPLQSAKVADIYYPLPDQTKGSDWVAIALGVLAIVSLLGLIPLWYIVFLRFTGS